MAKYVIDIDKLECCEDCPHDFAYHDRHGWYPMMELESEPSVVAMKEQIRALESKIHRQRDAIAELTRREHWYDTVSTSKDQQILSLTRLVSELCDLVEWNRMSAHQIAPIAHEMEALGICTVSEFYKIVEGAWK